MVERIARDREKLNQTPLDFVVVGSGQVVDKYWLRSVADGNARIPVIVSLEPEDSFRKRNPGFDGAYHKSESVADTLALVSSIVKGKPQPNIALVTPVDVRLDLAQEILKDPDLSEARLYIEKPYAEDLERLTAFEKLVAEYTPRMHLSGKYANVRAGILYPHLPQGRVPKRITARLIEGTEYFTIVREKLAKEGYHQYLVDGPELDMGFHLTNIVTSASERFGGISRLRITDVYDLSKANPQFEEHFGFGAELVIQTKNGDTIFVDLQAGKADAPNERFIEFDYGDMIVGQEYTVGDARDPVYVVADGVKETVSEHPKGFNYYAGELLPAVFCKQKPEQQQNSLFATRVCLELKKRRQESVT